MNPQQRPIALFLDGPLKGTTLEGSRSAGLFSTYLHLEYPPLPPARNCARMSQPATRYLYHLTAVGDHSPNGPMRLFRTYTLDPTALSRDSSAALRFCVEQNHRYELFS